MTETELPLVLVISFGYGHTGVLDDDGETLLVPPEADITLDLRRRLRNPHCDPAMRTLTGLDTVVFDHVLATPGAQMLAQQTALAAIVTLTQGPLPGLTIAAGCVGGRHRAVAVAREINRWLGSCSSAGPYRTELIHRDVHRDVLASGNHR